jgi:DNA-binding response OmpR family regulator
MVALKDPPVAAALVTAAPASKALIVSNDPQVLEPANAVIRREGFSTEICGHREINAGIAFRLPRLRLVVFDDSGIDAAERSWLMARLRRWVPDARVLYVAGAHSPQSESDVRRSGVNYYLPKPVDGALLTKVLHGLIRSIR